MSLAMSMRTMVDDVIDHFSDSWTVRVRRVDRTIDPDTGNPTETVQEATDVKACVINFKEDKINRRDIQDSLLVREDIRIAISASDLSFRPDEDTRIIDDDRGVTYAIIRIMNEKPGGTQIYWDIHARSVGR